MVCINPLTSPLSLVLFLVPPAVRLVVHDLAFARDERHAAGDPVCVDELLHEAFDTLEPR